MFRVTSYIRIILHSPMTKDMKMFYHKYEILLQTKELLPPTQNATFFFLLNNVYDEGKHFYFCTFVTLLILR